MDSNEIVVRIGDPVRVVYWSNAIEEVCTITGEFAGAHGTHTPRPWITVTVTDDQGNKGLRNCVVDDVLEVMPVA